MSVEASGKRKWPRAYAAEVANEICSRIRPVCERIVVAGSLRRKRPEVGDVEILYIPKMEERQADLFSMEMVSLADEEIERMLADSTLAKRPSITGATAWGQKNKLALHRTGMPVDLFRTNELSWWNYLVCRTGPADSNVRIATAAQRKGWKWNPYGAGFTRMSDSEIISMESEESVFAFVGLDYRAPEDRQ